MEKTNWTVTEKFCNQTSCNTSRAAQDKLIMNIKWRNLVKNDSEVSWPVNIKKKKSDFIRTAVSWVALKEDHHGCCSPGRERLDQLYSGQRLCHLSLTWPGATSEDGNQAVVFHVLFKVWIESFQITVSRIFIHSWIIEDAVVDARWGCSHILEP